MNWIYVFIGGGIGSLARYGVGLLTSKFTGINFPIGTLVSNVVACVILGIVLYSFSEKLIHHSWVQPLVIVGICGGFSTFSTFSNETLQLMANGNYSIAITNVFISLLAGIGSIYFISTLTK
jgi:CrcB protein